MEKTYNKKIVSPVMSADIFLSPSETILQDFSMAHKPAVPSGILTLMGQLSEWKLMSTELVIEKHIVPEDNVAWYEVCGGWKMPLQ